ncbi:hypothetical protein HMPREF9540_00092 [Escherichia coli MS 115-1]|nr:hypothetical protein HMPREF9540_00092 [Escherichia coli MS 115-1]
MNLANIYKKQSKKQNLKQAQEPEPVEIMEAEKWVQALECLL